MRRAGLLRAGGDRGAVGHSRQAFGAPLLARWLVLLPVGVCGERPALVNHKGHSRSSVHLAVGRDGHLTRLAAQATPSPELGYAATLAHIQTLLDEEGGLEKAVANAQESGGTAARRGQLYGTAIGHLREGHTSLEAATAQLREALRNYHAAELDGTKSLVSGSKGFIQQTTAEEFGGTVDGPVPSGVRIQDGASPETRKFKITVLKAEHLQPPPGMDSLDGQRIYVAGTKSKEAAAKADELFETDAVPYADEADILVWRPEVHTVELPVDQPLYLQVSVQEGDRVGVGELPVETLKKHGQHIVYLETSDLQSDQKPALVVLTEELE